MLKVSSALLSAKPYVSAQLTIIEAPDFTLTQYAGSEKDLKKALGKLPSRVGIVQDGLLRISPSQVWQLLTSSQPTLRGPLHGHLRVKENSDRPHPEERARASLEGSPDIALLPNIFKTDLSSSRTRIEISGGPAREVLAKCTAIDFHKNEFKPNTFAQTGIHHVPVLIQCVAGEIFHLYVLRTFALSIWDHLTDAALEFNDATHSGP